MTIIGGTKINKQRTNLIPSAATVTLPTSEYYALIKLADNLLREEAIQLAGVEVVLNDGIVSIKHNDVKPYIESLTDHVAELLSQNDDAMESLVNAGNFRYTAYNSWLSNYSWDGVDLKENYPAFAKAWDAAEARIQERELREEDLVDVEPTETGD